MNTTNSVEQDKNLKDCSAPNLWDEYFRLAENDIHQQWDEIIWPLIKFSDFSNVLEIAPGGGRNTEKLLKLTNNIQLVDLNEYAIKKCKERFKNKTTLRYHINNGKSLPMIYPESVSFIYSWDAFVHFSPTVIHNYIAEFARILKPGGTCYIHHSNYGLNPNANDDFKMNPHWRSNMSGQLMNNFCFYSGLRCFKQSIISWGGIPRLDCISQICKDW